MRKAKEASIKQHSMHICQGVITLENIGLTNMDRRILWASRDGWLGGTADGQGGTVVMIGCL